MSSPTPIKAPTTGIVIQVVITAVVVIALIAGFQFLAHNLHISWGDPKPVPAPAPGPAPGPAPAPAPKPFPSTLLDRGGEHG